MVDPEQRRAEAFERLHILDAFVAVPARRDELLSIVGDSASADEARTAVQQRFGLDEIQATAALDLQVRRFAARQRNRIIDERDELRRVVDAL